MRHQKPLAEAISWIHAQDGEHDQECCRSSADRSPTKILAVSGAKCQIKNIRTKRPEIPKHQGHPREHDAIEKHQRVPFHAFMLMKISNGFTAGFNNPFLCPGIFIIEHGTCLSIRSSILPQRIKYSIGLRTPSPVIIPTKQRQLPKMVS